MEGDFNSEQLRSLNDEGYQIWQYVNYHSKTNRFVREENIISIGGFFVDADGNLPEVLAQIATLSLPTPTWVIATGGPDCGHVHWRLTTPHKDLGIFKPIQRRLAEILGTDTRVCDLPRVYRIPGFVNHKWGKLATMLSSGPSLNSLDILTDALGIQHDDSSENITRVSGSLESNGNGDIGGNVNRVDSLKDHYLSQLPLSPSRILILEGQAAAQAQLLNRQLHSQLQKVVSEGLQGDQTRNDLELLVARLASLSNLTFDESYLLLYRALQVHPEKSKEVSSGNWKFIQSHFRTVWSNWQLKANYGYHCCACGRTKPQTEFYRDKSRFSGLRSVCKQCDNSRRSERRRCQKEGRNSKTPNNLRNDKKGASEGASILACQSVTNDFYLHEKEHQMKCVDPFDDWLGPYDGNDMLEATG